MLGRPPGRGQSLTVDLAELDRVIARSGAAPGLASALAAIHGPITDERAKRAAESAAWEAVWERAAAPARERGLAAWLAELRAAGLLRRLAAGAADAEALLQRFWALVDRLPAGGTPVSALATAVAGDAHALDPGRPLAALARRYLRQRAGEGADDDPHTLWALAGVRVGGGVTSRALVLNLPAAGNAATDRLLETAAGAGAPLWLTLRDLVDAAPTWDPARAPRVHVCENPAVLAAAADELGARSAPVVCTDGNPGAAVVALLRGLGGAGCELFYQGDFDWAGIAIGERVIAGLGAGPWRYDAAAYRDAAARHEGRPLTGKRVEASWDPALAAAMSLAGRAIDQEAVIPELVGDLGASGGG